MKHHLGSNQKLRYNMYLVPQPYATTVLSKRAQLMNPTPATPPAATPQDHAFMAQALRLAARGINTTHPNPRVGCVVVKNGEVVGAGWHQRAGEAHAEVRALAQAKKRAQAATLYLTLEPCSHHGRTPPCVDAIVKAKIARAVIAMLDPNPQVNGSGVAALQAAGIATQVGVGEAEAKSLNRGFCKRFTAQRPWVTLKIAASLDGKTAMASGQSQWITSKAARQDGHKLRAAAAAILTGTGTVLRDDPRMTVRLEGEDAAPIRPPLRVVLDSHLSVPKTARILNPPGEVVLFTAAEVAGAELTYGENVEVVRCAGSSGRVDLTQAMRELARREINEVLVEGGAQLCGALLQAELVDQLIAYFAPAVLGGDARDMFALAGVSKLAQRQRLAFTDVRRVGADLRVCLEVLGEGASLFKG